MPTPAMPSCKTLVGSFASASSGGTPVFATAQLPKLSRVVGLLLDGLLTASLAGGGDIKVGLNAFAANGTVANRAGVLAIMSFFAPSGEYEGRTVWVPTNVLVDQFLYLVQTSTANSSFDSRVVIYYY